MEVAHLVEPSVEGSHASHDRRTHVDLEEGSAMMVASFAVLLSVLSFASLVQAATFDLAKPTQPTRPQQ